MPPRYLPVAHPCNRLPLQKPKPDADGFIWHPRPGYPNQEISEPDAQGRVAYKIHMTGLIHAATPRARRMLVAPQS